MAQKKTVFLTGATGNLGWAGFQELYGRKDRFDIRILARDSKKNRNKLDRYLDDPSVTVIWGDLTRYEDVLKGVTGSDYVLHVGGMVSPAADYFPEKTLKVNVSAAECHQCTGYFQTAAFTAGESHCFLFGKMSKFEFVQVLFQTFIAFCAGNIKRFENCHDMLIF